MYCGLLGEWSEEEESEEIIELREVFRQSIVTEEVNDSLDNDDTEEIKV